MTTTPTIHSDVQVRHISDGIQLKRIGVGPNVYYQLWVQDDGKMKMCPAEANELRLLRLAINDLVGEQVDCPYTEHPLWYISDDVLGKKCKECIDVNCPHNGNQAITCKPPLMAELVQRRLKQ